MKPSQIKGLSKLYSRRFPADLPYTKEQARELAALTADIGRQIGLLIDRQGRPAMVIVGSPSSIFIPELPRQRQSSGRLRGLRLLHTHINEGNLSQEDLMDMVFLRLDSVCLLSVDKQGTPEQFAWAHLLPSNQDDRLYSVNSPIEWDKVDTDITAKVEALEEELARQGNKLGFQSDNNRAVLVSVSPEPKHLQERSLNELEDLCTTAGLEVTGRLVQRVKNINPKHILGKGKLADLEVMALQNNTSVIVFDCELSPTQIRNLADITERKILDRTQLILDIFAQHATTKPGKLQVEMAQLRYTLPRLVGQNKALSRLTGGIGGRGPGETKLELDRRKVRNRITNLRNELKKVRQHRGATRSHRARMGLPVVALVGYTNAGKSTLLNVLTNSRVLTQNKLFATLDPTSRRVRFPEEKEVILTDTVGFIRELPEELKQAFMATLEELRSADISVQVADGSHPELDDQVNAVTSLLEELELARVPKILALNKWDLLDSSKREIIRNTYPHGIPISARLKENLGNLVQAIVSQLEEKDGRGDVLDLESFYS